MATCGYLSLSEGSSWSQRLWLWYLSFSQPAPNHSGWQQISTLQIWAQRKGQKDLSHCKNKRWRGKIPRPFCANLLNFCLFSPLQSIVLCSFGPWVPIHHMSLTQLTQTMAMVQSWACLLLCISYSSYSFSLFVPCDCDPLAVWIGAKLSQFSQGFAYSITTSPRADNSTTHVQGWDTASSFTTCWHWQELLW